MKLVQPQINQEMPKGAYAVGTKPLMQKDVAVCSIIFPLD